MIYVIQVDYYNHETNLPLRLLKIGYCDDSRKEVRLSSYKTENPLMTPIYFIEGGTETHEKRLHYKFRDYLFTGREWFIYSQEIIDFFSTATLEDFNNLELTKKEIEDLIPPKDNTIDLESVPEDFKDIASEFNKPGLRFRDRIRLVCRYFVKYGKEKDYVSLLPQPFSDYISALGSEYIVSVKGEKRKVEEAHQLLKDRGITTRPDDKYITEKIYQRIKVGEKKSKLEWKDLLRKIYTELGISNTPKATDLERWFYIHRVVISINNKRYEGFEILRQK